MTKEEIEQFEKDLFNEVVDKFTAQGVTKEQVIEAIQQGSFEVIEREDSTLEILLTF